MYSFWFQKEEEKQMVDYKDDDCNLQENCGYNQTDYTVWRYSYFLT